MSMNNRNFPNTPSGETFFQNLTDRELLQAVDRSRADVRALADKLEYALDLLDLIKSGDYMYALDLTEAEREDMK